MATFLQIRLFFLRCPLIIQDGLAKRAFCFGKIGSIVFYIMSLEGST